MYVHMMLLNFLPGQGVDYQIAEHSQGSYGRHRPGNCSKITNISGKNGWYRPYTSCIYMHHIKWEVNSSCTLVTIKTRTFIICIIQTSDRIMNCDSPSLSDLPSPVLIHDELSGLSRWVNDEGIAVEPLDHDGILNTEVIRGQGIGLPG